METRWIYTTSEYFHTLRQASKDTCLIPMGSIQKNELGVPIGESVLLAKEIALLASQQETVCVFPEFAFGDVPLSPEEAYPGSIVLSVETEMLLLEQLCHQIARNGFKKIAILNCSENQVWISAFLKKIENKPHNFVVMNIPIKKESQSAMVEKAVKAIQFIKEDEELVHWHNRLWSLTKEENLL